MVKKPKIKRELVLGCGNAKRKVVSIGNEGYEWGDPVFLDINPDVKPDVVHDLNVRPLPFKDEEFDEIHAYEVLEHIGMQGDYKGFFAEFDEYWRILKPGGLLVGSCPKHDSLWAWGDPSHVRIISPGTITFLSQRAYKEQCGVTPMTDFRYLWDKDFDLVMSNESEHSWFFVLQKGAKR